MRTFPLPQIIPSVRFDYTKGMGRNVLPNLVEAIDSGNEAAIRLSRSLIIPFMREAIRTYKDCAAPADLILREYTVSAAKNEYGDNIFAVIEYGRNTEWSVMYGAHWDTRTNRLVISTYCD